MKSISIFLLFIALTTKSFACYEAEIHKIYPIGIFNQTIISIDMDILRHNAGFFDENVRIEGNIINESYRDNEDFANYELEWIIKTSITLYDKSQNIIESIPLDSARFYTEKNGYIIDKLKILYQNGLDKIISTKKDIEFFTPVGISFGDYSKECINLISEDNSIINENDLVHFISAIKERPNNKFHHLLESQKLQLLSTFSSVSKYVCSSFELININTQIGQTFGDEELPEISLGQHIKSAIYQEPILYHGTGNDMFFIKYFD